MKNGPAQIALRIGKQGLAGFAIAAVVGCVIFSTPAKACDHQGALPSGVTVPFVRSAGSPAVAREAVTSATSTAGSRSIVGLWHVLLVSDGQPFDEGFDQWHRDGTEILNDTAPPQPANGAGTVCLGVYKKTGPGTYKLKHPFWSFDANANLVGSGVILQTVTLGPDGNTYQGSFTFHLFDLSGTLVFEATGTLSAERITAD